MRNLLSSFDLKPENMLSASDLLNFRGGHCDVQICVNCSVTAVGLGYGGNYGACGYSCGCGDCGCYSQCGQNMLGQCFTMYGNGTGCYCGGGNP